MKTPSIPNRYDGPRKPPKKSDNIQFTLDYVSSDKAEDIDAGIRETIKGVRMSIIAMGVGLAKIKAKGLYIDLKHHSMSKYIERLAEDTQMERSSVFNWLYVGEAYLAFRSELEKIGFTDEDGPTKLPYVSRALVLYPKRGVFKNLKEMSMRAFIGWARGGDADEAPPSKIRVVGNRIFVGKTPAVTLSEELDPKTKAYFANINAEAGRALEAGEVILPVRLYDMDELRRFERAADKLKKELRINYKGRR
jgi:hypothetical protein